MKIIVRKIVGFIGKRIFLTDKIRNLLTDNIRKGKFCNLFDTKFDRYSSVGNYSNIQNSSIGAYSTIGRFANIFSCELGKFCSVSWNVTIGAPSHPINNVTTHAFPYIKLFNMVNKDKRIRKQTTVGNDVWIGAGVIIMPGIKIGNGVVIGAGAIITKDIPSYAIVVGNPGKIQRFRFDKGIIESLEKMAWWDWDESKIKRNLNYFRTPLDHDLVNLLGQKS